jgi:hypothetical protein
MFTEIRIYYEGHALLQSGFHAFFKDLRVEAAKKRVPVQFIAAYGKPCRDFNIATTQHPAAWNILLKDREGPDNGDLSIGLCAEQGWDKSLADSIFWMVEMMESWFHADKEALATFYGKNFQPGSLKPNRNVEEIPKKDLKSGLKAATRKTLKGDYFDNKTSHGPKLLEAIDPAKVRKAAPNCEKLFRAVLARLGV